MKKVLLVSTAALAMFGGAYAFAQQGPRPDGPPRPGMEMNRYSPEDRAAFLDGRIAAAKAVLKLTPEQEKLWPAFETALRDAAKTREAARAQRDAEREKGPAGRPDPVARLRMMGQNDTARGAAMTKLADAAAPLYASLDDAQKRRVERFLPHGGPGGPGMREHHRGPMGDGPRGPMGDGPRGPARP